MAITIAFSGSEVTKNDDGFTSDTYNTVSNITAGQVILLSIQAVKGGSTAPAISSITNDAGAQAITWNLIRSDTKENTTTGVTERSSLYYGIAPTTDNIYITVNYDSTTYISCITIVALSGANILLPDVDEGTSGSSTTVDWPAVTMAFPSFYLFYIYSETAPNTDTNNAADARPTTGTDLKREVTSVNPSGTRYSLLTEVGWDNVQYTAPGTVDFTPTATLEYTNSWITQVLAVYDATGGQSDVFNGVLF